MHFSRRILIAAIGSTIMLVSAGVGMAHGVGGSPTMPLTQLQNYSGNWPVTVTQSQRGNATYCLTLSQNTSNGGSASLVSGSQKYPYGTFQIFNGILVATIQAQGYGQNAGLVFIGRARSSSIGPGVFDEVYGGEAFVEGALAFGMKGGC